MPQQKQEQQRTRRGEHVAGPTGQPGMKLSNEPVCHTHFATEGSDIRMMMKTFAWFSYDGEIAEYSDLKNFIFMWLSGVTIILQEVSIF